MLSLTFCAVQLYVHAHTRAHPSLRARWLLLGGNVIPDRNVKMKMILGNIYSYGHREIITFLLSGTIEIKVTELLCPGH